MSCIEYMLVFDAHRDLNNTVIECTSRLRYGNDSFGLNQSYAVTINIGKLAKDKFNFNLMLCTCGYANWGNTRGFPPPQAVSVPEDNFFFIPQLQI